MQTIAQQLGIKKFPFEIKDDNGNRIYYESSDGYWNKSKYDEKGNEIYRENSDGKVIDKRTPSISTTLLKAAELINKMYYTQSSPTSWMQAKECALIAVDEILDTIRIHLIKDPSAEEVVKFVETRIIYWQEVKQEIEKL